MNYEKKYEQALERARECMKDGGISQNTIDYLCNIFPELKESEDEDEIIRKEIEQLIQCMCDEDTRKGRWLDWLEKQGVQKSNMYDAPKISIKDAVEVTSRMKYIPNDMKSIADFIIDYAHWDLQKSEWNQPTITVPLFRVLDALIQKGKPYCGGKSALEAIKEEKVDNSNKAEPKDYNSIDPYFAKPIDKVKPKFKVGDWIVNEEGDIAHINDVRKDCYNIERYYIEYLDGTKTDPMAYLVDEDFHLWNIQDAKEGDVLVAPKRDGSEHSEQIFIFKEIKDREYVKNAVEYYCRVVDNEFYENERGFMGQRDDYFIPATKEQRDLLFQKMKEAGYEWDSVKKELKKIKVKFEVDDWITLYGGEPLKIVKIESETNGVLDYLLLNQNGYNTYFNKQYVDKNAKLWALEDAKKGDVVVCKGDVKHSSGVTYESICLFNNLDSAFFTLTRNSNGIEEYSIDVTIAYPDNTVPATKEQKEILFMAMKDAGYELDVENKELKKQIT